MVKISYLLEFIFPSYFFLVLTDTVVQLGWGTGRDWAIGYALLAVLLVYAAWQSRADSRSKS